MKASKSIYTSKNIITLVTLLFLISWLLYSLASSWYENRKITQEIEAIRQENEEKKAEIEEKKERLAYLQTPHRIDKEAKMQMNRRQEGEKVLILVEEKMDLIPTQTINRTKQHVEKDSVPIIDKWKWLFLGQKN